jgi:hypothetical protein
MPAARTAMATTRAADLGSLLLLLLLLRRGSCGGSGSSAMPESTMGVASNSSGGTTTSASTSTSDEGSPAVGCVGGPVPYSLAVEDRASPLLLLWLGRPGTAHAPGPSWTAGPSLQRRGSGVRRAPLSGGRWSWHRPFFCRFFEHPGRSGRLDGGCRAFRTARSPGPCLRRRPLPLHRRRVLRSREPPPGDFRPSSVAWLRSGTDEAGDDV